MKVFGIDLSKPLHIHNKGLVELDTGRKILIEDKDDEFIVTIKSNQKRIVINCIDGHVRKNMQTISSEEHVPNFSKESLNIVCNSKREKQLIFISYTYKEKGKSFNVHFGNCWVEHPILNNDDLKTVEDFIKRDLEDNYHIDNNFLDLEYVRILNTGVALHE